MPTPVQAHRLVSSDRVIGTDVYGIGDEAIGQIDHLLIEKVSGKIAYAIMNFGGFLELAHKYYPIPWTALRYDTELGGYRTGITESHLRDAPEFSGHGGRSRLGNQDTPALRRTPLLGCLR